MKATKILSTIAVAAVMAVSAPTALAQSGMKLGVIECNVVPGSRVNLLVRSTADVMCDFKGAGGTTEKYKGETGIAFGLDLSFKNNSTIRFAVFAASSDVQPSAEALAGKYVGGEVTAAAGVGLGAKALVGGGNKNISLHPLAVETGTGLGVSGGIGYLYLEPL